MGMMPLCLFIYAKIWTDANAIVLPYNSIGESSGAALPFLLYTIIMQSHEEITPDFEKYLSSCFLIASLGIRYLNHFTSSMALQNKGLKSL